MPADPSAGRILRHHELVKCVRGRSADPTRNLREWPKVSGNTRVSTRFLACEDVSLPKSVYATISLVAVKFERLQRQFLKLLNETHLLRGRENVPDVTEAGWQLGRRLGLAE